MGIHKTHETSVSVWDITAIGAGKRPKDIFSLFKNQTITNFWAQAGRCHKGPKIVASGSTGFETEIVIDFSNSPWSW